MDDFYDWMPFILLCVPGTTSAFLTMLKVTGAPISIDIMWCILSPFVIVWGIFLSFLVILFIIKIAIIIIENIRDK